MKAFLISPDHQNQRAALTVVDVAQSADGDARLEHLYRLLDCTTVQVIETGMQGTMAGHALVVDEDGIFKEPAGFLFMPRIQATPLAGKVLILGYGDNSDSAATLAEAAVSETEVRALISCAYCSPAYAKAALRLHEDAIRRRFPGVIVVPGSQSILPDK